MRFIVFVAPLTLAACSLLTPLDGLSSSEPTTPNVEAGADASSDASSDVDVSVDADIDAAAALDSGLNEASVSPCVSPSAHAFCDDFDSVDGNFSSWSERVADDPATLTVSTSHAVTAPHAMHAFNPRQAATAAMRTAALNKNFQSPWRRVVVDFDVYVEPPAFQSADSTSGLIEVSFFSSGAASSDNVTQGIAFGIADDLSVMSGISAGTYVSAPDQAGIEYGQWLHAHVDIVPGGACTATVGMHEYLVTLPPLTQGTDPEVSVEVGVFGYNVPSAELSVFIDNVVVDMP